MGSIPEQEEIEQIVGLVSKKVHVKTLNEINNPQSDNKQAALDTKRFMKKLKQK